MQAHRGFESRLLRQISKGAESVILDSAPFALSFKDSFFAAGKIMKLKALPNLITFSRIALSPFLLIALPFSASFYIIYILCGLSDVLDGFIARKTHSTSAFGARLDSIADLLMFVALLIALFRVLDLSLLLILWIILICIIRFASIGIIYKKYKTFAILHTYGNKLTGALLFLSPVLLLVIPANSAAYLLCLVATASALEELLINLKSPTLNVDRASIFT